MARKGKGGNRWLWRVLGALVLLGVVAGSWFWWSLRSWRPLESDYPDQGVEVSAAAGDVNFRTVAAIGGSFAYLDASGGNAGKDSAFARNLAAARDAGLQVGALHRFDPCEKADGQSANFVTMVPRSRDMLPPAIALAGTAEDCSEPVSEAAVESELMTFLNQVEGHVGKPALLKVSPAFEKTYRLAARLERNLWLTRTYFRPDYGGRPWTLWTATTMLHLEAGKDAVRWVVVQQ